VQVEGGADALIGVGGRHAYVDDRQVGRRFRHRLDEAMSVANTGCDLVTRF
jgi:hypothetical protein